MLEDNIILTGFMGTGKTAVGREWRHGWACPFVDLDDLIVQRAGKAIPKIFAQDGEPAFRALEAACCAEMAAPTSLVIATGGGAVVNPANREALAVGGHGDLPGGRFRYHPPARGPGRRSADVGRPGSCERGIRELLTARVEATAALPHHRQDPPDHPGHGRQRAWGIAAGLPEGGHVLTVRDERRTTNDETDTSSFVIRPTGMLRVLVRQVTMFSSPRELLHQAGHRILAVGLKPGRCVVVTDPTGEHHLPGLVAALADAGVHWWSSRFLTARRTRRWRPWMVSMTVSPKPGCAERAGDRPGRRRDR